MSRPATVFLIAASLPTLFSGGCSQPKTDDNPPPATALSGITVRLVVVGDAELAAAAGRLRGEWNAQTGGLFEVESVSAEEFDPSDRLAGDAVICASHYLGLLAENKTVRPIPQETIQENWADWQDVFEMLRRSEASWIDRPVGVPFGSPVLTVLYRADLLEGLDRKPPETWAEYHELAGLLADRTKLGNAALVPGTPWSGVIEPLGPGWAGLTLLARAAPYAKHRDDYAALFDMETMEPLVAGPPFVRALEELVAAARCGLPEDVAAEAGVADETSNTGSLDSGAIASLEYDPAGARAAFWRGECGMALCWPTRADELDAREVATLAVGFAPLPGSQTVFNHRKETWQRRADDEDRRVPLVGIGGRVGVVGRESENPEAAFRLLFWLSGRQYGTTVAGVSGETTLCRSSQLAEPGVWVEQPVGRPAAAQYAKTVDESFSGSQWVVAPRIPGREAYLGVLDEAVRRAVGGEQTPAAALGEAATRWREITDRLGVEKQRAAYCHSLGLEP